MNSHRLVVSTAQEECNKGIQKACSSSLSPAFNFLNVQPETTSKSPFIRSQSPDWPKNSTFSRSSTFCTNLYSSSSSANETQKHLGNSLPFLPDPSASASGVESARSPSVFSEDLGNPFDGDNNSSLVKDFFNLSADACSNGGGYHDLDCSNDTLSDQLELQFLSDELELAITDRAETPRLDVSYFYSVHLLWVCYYDNISPKWLVDTYRECVKSDFFSF